MNIILNGHDCKYALEQATLLFFPETRPRFHIDPGDPDFARSVLVSNRRSAHCFCELRRGGATARDACLVDISGAADAYELERLIRFAVKTSFCRAAAQLTGGMPPWGTLTGIRPVKIASELLRRSGSPEYADHVLKEDYYVGAQRRELCLDCAKAGIELEKRISPQETAVYIGIPFCPTRCLYCSFVSRDVKRAQSLIAPYLEALAEEIRYCGDGLRKRGATVSYIYVGGGTPTSLTAPQLDFLLKALDRAFSLEGLREFTVEAGRPDTITEEKLDVLKAYRGARLSINPQTLNDRVLKIIGRDHTAQDTLSAYRLARDAGFNAINMDLIAGLPGDDFESFRSTLEQVIALAPSNITVHTLSVKRGSDLYGDAVPMPDAAEVVDMLDYANGALRGSGYGPYYLYRQKFMAAALENTGWALKGAGCAYNMLIMEELCPVLALGAGGVTKMVNTARDRIERVFNPKYPDEYIRRISDVLLKKTEFLNFWDSR